MEVDNVTSSSSNGEANAKSERVMSVALRVLLLGVAGFLLWKWLKNRKPIEIACFGCDPGGEGYVCKPGTGLGSAQCALYQDFRALGARFQQEAKELRDKAMSALANLQALQSGLQTIFQELRNLDV